MLHATVLTELLNARKPGWSLPQPFYVSASVHELDMDHVFRTGWLFVGHTSEIKTSGDFITYEIAGEPLIIVRQDDGEICALLNVCRHRGSRICKTSSGNTDRLVCPYHQWTYDKNGQLLHNTWMPADFDRTDFSLDRAHVRVVAGLIFVSLAKQPESFEPASDLLKLLGMQGIDHSKVAYTETYDIAANWKLVIENQRECYHCPANHQDYARIQLDTEQHDPAQQQANQILSEAARGTWKAQGLDVTMVRSDSDFNGSWWRTSRALFRAPHVSETMNGKPAAPLMGSFRSPNVGNARANTYPNFWLHASCDHVHTMRVTPIDATTTRISASWLVDENAIEDQDYRIDELIGFSKLVNEEDHEILTEQAKGVISSHYRPGPYSPVKEAAVEHFVAWYVNRLSTGHRRRT